MKASAWTIGRIACFPFLLIIAAANSYCQSSVSTYQELRQQFAKPPDTARPKAYWWWLNGNVNPLRLKEELAAMKKAGITGVDIFDIGGPEVPNPDNMIPAGPPFMGEESLQYIKFAIEEAGKLGFEVNLSLSSSWNAGGKWTQPQHAAKTLYLSKVAVKGSGKQKIRLPFPEITPDAKGNPRPIAYRPDGKPVYFEEVVVLAIPIHQHVMDTAEIVNVSRYFDAEKEILDWKIPNGRWEIHRYICANSGKQLNSPSPNSNGLVIDHFDSTATRAHLTYFIDRLKPLLGDFRDTALKGFYLASYEASDLHWTPSMPAEFKQRNGYDIYKFIPAIFNRHLFSPQLTEDFQFDFRKTKSELMINNHYRKAKEICNKHGLNLISESGGPGGWHSIPVEAIKSLGSLDIPRGEFWNKYEVHDIGDYIDVKWLIKEIAAASHIYGKGLVEAEAFTSWQHWQEGPADLRPLADRAFCEGMNRVIIHGFSHEPSPGRLPGITFYAGTHFNDRNVWWPKIRPFNEYMARVSHMLQKSKFVSDVLYYNGNDVPNLVPPKNTHFAVGPGYDYEIINTDILLNKLTVKDGELSIPGVARYKVLSIGEDSAVDPLVLKKLTQLAEAGALIIGDKPVQAQGLRKRKEADEVVRTLADKYWVTATANDINATSFRKGVIYSNILSVQALNELGVPPDFSYYDPQSSSLDYIHYQTDGLDFYFVRNTTDQWISRKCSFRQQEKIPEIWDPVSGDIYPIPIYNQRDKHVDIPLTWAPYGAYFVVFRNGSPSSHYTDISAADMHSPRIAYTTNGFHVLDKGTFRLNSNGGPMKIANEPAVFELQGEWKISFPDNWGAPTAAMFPELISWTEAEDKGIKYFSGTAVYEKNFTLKNVSQDERTYLDLGALAEVAEVWFNDQRLGITWTEPHRFDISSLVRQGENTIKVEIANTWSNRLIGDAKTKEKFTDTNMRHGNPNLLLDHHIRPNNVKAPWSELPLRKSGLLGPVTISSYKTRL
jgi:hypothetical protein